MPSDNDVIGMAGDASRAFSKDQDANELGELELRDAEARAPWLKGERAEVLSAQRLTRLRGLEIIRDPFLNKGTAFSERERDMLGLRGLIPPVFNPIEKQLVRQKASWEKMTSNMQKYVWLERMHNRNETLYYRFILENIGEAMPIVYTPTVGQACLEFSDLYRSRVRGLYFSIEDRGHFKDICKNWPQHDVEIIVVTDGSRILGLGDLGVNGLGIPIGKLALYVAAAGFMPWRTLPIVLDMGTDNKELRETETYIGTKKSRPDEKTFHDTVAEFVEAVKWRWPDVLIQWEDFSTDHAFDLLAKYRDDHCSFNDDIQGTAAVVLAGLLAALRIQKPSQSKPTNLRDQRIVFLGAGSAGVGVAELIAQGMYLESRAAGDEKPVEYWRKNNFWLIDSKGLVTTTRGDKLQAHKIPFARDEETQIPTLMDCVKIAKPTVLLGLAGLPGGAFTEEMVKTMAADCEAEKNRPILMALSNPTSKAECTAEQAYTWTDGKAIFASGSPFDPVTLPDGRTFVTGQGNNMFIFPGVGYGAVACKASKITESMFYEAARRLALITSVEDLKKGSLYPDVKEIRTISCTIAAGICDLAVKEKLNRVPTPKEGWMKHLKSNMWWPHYEEYV